VIIQDQEQKHVTGHVGSGNMKLFEFFGKEVNDKVPFDVVDDVHFHMIDDDAFYRKHYLPCMDSIKGQNNQDVIRGHVMPMIEKCLNHYVNKFDLTQTPEELMTEEEKTQLLTKIMEYEKNPPKEEDAFTKPV